MARIRKEKTRQGECKKKAGKGKTMQGKEKAK